MHNYEFYTPYAEMVLFAVVCIVCMCIGGWIIKKFWKGFPPYLIPITLIGLSFVVANLYYNGLDAFLQWDTNDVRAIINGLAAVGLHQVITKTYRYFRIRTLRKQRKLKQLKQSKQK